MVNSDKCHVWPIFHARTFSKTLQEQCHELPILSSRVIMVKGSTGFTGLTNKKQSYLSGFQLKYCTPTFWRVVEAYTARVLVNIMSVSDFYDFTNSMSYHTNQSRSVAFLGCKVCNKSVNIISAIVIKLFIIIIL